MQRLLRDRTAVALCAIAIVMAGACVQADDPDVGISPLSADIVFGVKPLADAEAEVPGVGGGSTGDGGVTDAFAGEEEEDEDDEPSQTFNTVPPKKFTPVPFEAAAPGGGGENECPAAALDEFPDEVAPTNVTEEPKPGVWRWKRTGSLAKSDGSVTDVSGLERRTISELRKESADPTAPKRMRYQFDITYADPSDPEVQITVTYRVDTGAAGAEAESPVGGERASGGEPERGLSLKRFVAKRGDKTIGTFAPTTGLLLLPLPVRSGESFSSVAIDPSTQQTWRYTAQVKQRRAIDACGTLLDGWVVEGTQQISGSNGGSRGYNLVVGNQRGGLLLSERSEVTTSGGPVVLENTIGSDGPVTK